MAVFTVAGAERVMPSGLSHEVAATSAPALPHQRALDGLRGVAVLAVLAYHLGWLPGGFLGVSLFFTLSGYLITNLLLREGDRSGTIRLSAFWARRARRLLPAALAGITLAILVAVVTGTPDQLRALPGDVVGALAYGANWRFVLAHDSYRAGFAAPSPLLHYWSLAIEEQLYLVVPLLVAVVTVGTRHRRARLGAALGLAMGISAAATIWLGPGRADRIYFGTDTRMFELLAGALLAVVLGFPRAGGDHGGRRRVAGALGAAACVSVGALWATTHQSDAWLYRGGLWGVSALSCALIVGACWGGRVRRMLGWRLFPPTGRISYGLYVYHWPLFVALDASRTGLHGVSLGAVRLAATLAVALASYHWLEQPIRTRRVPTGLALRAAAPVAIAALVAAALLANGMAAARSIAPTRASRLTLAAGTQPGATTGLPHSRAADTSPAPPGAATQATGPRSVSPSTAGQPTTTVAAPVPPLDRVLFMGDSLVQQAYPTFAERLRRQGIDSRVVGGNGQSLMTHDAAWLGQLTNAVGSYDPDVVVLESCCGQFRFDAPLTEADGQAIPPATPAFETAWRTLAVRASQIASSRGALVVWILGPPTHTNGWYGPIDGQIAGINAVYRTLATCPTRSATIDWSAVGGPGGSYADALPDGLGHLVTVRQPDGFHFTPPGIDALASVTLPAITGSWSAGGRAGPWPAACP